MADPIRDQVYESRRNEGDTEARDGDWRVAEVEQDSADGDK
jgi:hypothetical protein